jgi:hypothetical protein
MLRFFSDIFNSSDLSPHGICLLWRPELIWLHVTSDAIIALSYYSIPLALTYFVLKRRDVVFGWLFWMFGAFILACGTTHVFGILTLWYPVYGIAGAVKSCCGRCCRGRWPCRPPPCSPEQTRNCRRRLTSATSFGNAARERGTLPGPLRDIAAGGRGAAAS